MKHDSEVVPCRRASRFAGVLVLAAFGMAAGSGRAGDAWDPAPDSDMRPVSTFSIVAFDPAVKEWGVAVQSRFFAVGTVVPWAKAGVGALATQAYANLTYGPEGLAMLEDGGSAEEVVRKLTGGDPGRDRRQLGVVDAEGRAASHTGSACNEWAGHIVGTHFCVQGNILAGEGVVRAMVQAFERARETGEGELADWLMAALHAGQAAGGDTRGQQSAALLVVREAGGYGGANDRFIDLRVDDHRAPIDELSRLLELHKEFHGRAHRRKGK